MIKELMRFEDYTTIFREYIPMVGYMYSRNPKLSYKEDSSKFIIDLEQSNILESFGVILKIDSYKSNTILIVEEGVTVQKAVEQFNSLEGGNITPTHYVVLDRDNDVINFKNKELEILYPKASTINYIYSEVHMDRFPNVKNKFDISSYLENISNHGPSVIGPNSLGYYTDALKRIKSDIGDCKFVYCSLEKFTSLFNEVAVDLYLLYRLIPLSTSISQLCTNLISSTYNTNLPVYDLLKQLERLPRLLTSFNKNTNYLAITGNFELSMDVSAIPISDLGIEDKRMSSMKITNKSVTIKDIFDLTGIYGRDMSSDVDNAESLKDIFVDLRSALSSIETSPIYSVFNTITFEAEGVDYIGFLYRDSLKLKLDAFITVPSFGKTKLVLGLENLKELVPMDFNFRTLKAFTKFSKNMGVKDNRPLYNIRYPYIYSSASWKSTSWKDIPNSNYLSLCMYDRASIQSRGAANKLLYDAIGEEEFFRVCDIFGGFSPVKRGVINL